MRSMPSMKLLISRTLVAIPTCPLELLTFTSPNKIVSVNHLKRLMILRIRVLRHAFQVANISALWKLDKRKFQPADLLLPKGQHFICNVSKPKTYFPLLKNYSPRGKTPFLPYKPRKPLRVKCSAFIRPEGQDGSRHVV